VTGFKSPLNPGDAAPALALLFQGKSMQIQEGKPLSFQGCPLLTVVLA
jgi:hypothetical protein